eukprot:4380768-Pleurochrysis_carterae.AAC.2
MVVLRTSANWQLVGLATACPAVNRTSPVCNSNRLSADFFLPPAKSRSAQATAAGCKDPLGARAASAARLAALTARLSLGPAPSADA